LRTQSLIDVMVFLALPPLACATMVTFEGLPDSTFVTTQFAGVTFTNAQILTSGVSLNELEFPPHSGSNVVTDYSGPMSILFTDPQQSVAGYFTYISPLTLSAYNATSNLIGSVFSAYSDNAALSGDPGSSPNELLQVTSNTGISRLVITGDPAGGSFVLDDLTFSTFATTIPEPSPFGMLGVGILVLAALQAFRKRTRSYCP
jgi:hypothetical protein